jgi:pyrroloquinoline-quinone synthase
MQLTRAHAEVEGGHRADAWRMVLAHTPPSLEDAVAYAVDKTLRAWHAYRDGVAERMGLRAAA